MSNTTICHYFFQINHTQSCQTPINYTNLTNSRSQRSLISTPFRKHIHIKALLSVSPLFQQNTPQLYASSSTPFHMSFRQPLMQWHQRYFHSKCQKETPPQNINNRRINCCLCLKHVRSSSPPALLQQYTRQHSQTSNQSIKNLLICCTYFSSSASTKSNLLEHGQLRTFILYIKAQSVQPSKSPKQKTFQCLQLCIKRLPMHILSIPTTLYCQRHLCSCKLYHPKTQTVQSKFLLNRLNTIPIPPKTYYMLEGKYGCWNKSSPQTHTLYQSQQTYNLCKQTMFFAFFTRNNTHQYSPCKRKLLYCQQLFFYRPPGGSCRPE